MDVGTGPAPTPYAITDFYGLLRTFAKEQGIPSLADQRVDVSVVERSRAMSYFMHHFSELAQRPGPFGTNRPDFSTVNPVEERAALRETLLRREYYDATTDEYFSEYLPDEANDIVQRHERYRLIVLSNFLTLSDSVRKFEPALRNLFSDLGYGAGVIVLGAGGGQYREIYRDLTAIAEACGMRNLSELLETLGSDSCSEAAQTIKRCQYNIFCHLERIAGSGRIQRVESYPDYWNPEPSPKKRTGFTLRVYRKGKWPHRATVRCGNRQATSSGKGGHC